MHKIVNGKKVPLTEKEAEALREKWSQVDLESRKLVYRGKRVTAYAEELGGWQEQLDFIYHNGIDKWKEAVKKIKDEYPKESS